MHVRVHSHSSIANAPKCMFRLYLGTTRNKNDKKIIQKCSKLLIVVWNQGRFLYCFMHIFMHDPSSAQQCLMIHMHALPQSLVGYVLAYLPHYEILLVWHPCIFICRIQLIFFVQLNYTLFLSRWQLMYRLFILLSL